MRDTSTYDHSSDRNKYAHFTPEARKRHATLAKMARDLRREMARLDRDIVTMGASDMSTIAARYQDERDRLQRRLERVTAEMAAIEAAHPKPAAETETATETDEERK